MSKKNCASKLVFLNEKKERYSDDFWRNQILALRTPILKSQSLSFGMLISV